MILLLAALIVTAPSAAQAMITISVLTKEQAKQKFGITMHARQNGDAGIKVWIEFKEEGLPDKYTYSELRLTDAQGKQLLSAKLQPNAVHHRQTPGKTTVYFSASPDQLKNYNILVVCYQDHGGTGYQLNLKDFLDMENPVTEE